MVKYLSVCSGIEAATNAWHDLGWEPVAFSEIDPFASAVLAARFPNVPNLGDLEKYREWNIEPGSVDVVVGGTPCQSFSVAGLRKGLDDPRGNLALVYLGLVDKLRPRYVVWENVPGVLSVDGGRAFGSFLGGLAQLGYGWAYRVMDAQYVRVESHPRAVPQRRRRVFVVGCARGDWQRAASILLEPEGVRGDSAPCREAGKEAPRGARPGAAGGGIAGYAVTAGDQKRADKKDWIYVNDLGISVPIDTAGADPTRRQGGTLIGPASVAWPAPVAPTLGTAWGDRHPGTNNQDFVSQSGGLFVPDAVEPGYIHPRQLRDSQSSNQLGIKPNAKVTDCLTSEGPGAVLVAPLPFDTTQVTSVLNRSNPLPGDPCHPLTRGGNPPAVAFATAAAAPPVAGTLGGSNRSGGFRTTDPETTGAFVPCFQWPVDVADPITAVAAISFYPNMGANARSDGAREGVAGTLAGAEGGNRQAVAAPTLTSANDPSRLPQSSEVTQQVAAVHTATMAVRRLTPRECERLQGFPDDWTAIVYRGKPAADGPRYKALGNSMAVNVMRWIGERIAMQLPCASCGDPVNVVFYQSPVRRDECTPCFDRRTGRRFAPAAPVAEKIEEEDMGKRDLKAETEEMGFVYESARGMALDTPEEVAEFQAMLEELRERKQGLIDALNAFETAEDAILDALDAARRAS